MNVGKIHAVATYEPERFNPIANATIPESWVVKLTITDKILEAVKCDNEHSHFQMYAYGNTCDEAIQDMIAQLKYYNLSGTLSVERRM